MASTSNNTGDLTTKQLLKNFESKMAEKEAVLSTMQEMLAEYKGELIKTAKALVQREAACEATAKALLQRETAVAAREKELAAIIEKTEDEKAEKSTQTGMEPIGPALLKSNSSTPNYTELEPVYPRNFDSKPFKAEPVKSNVPAPKKETIYVYVGHPLVENETDDWKEPQTREELKEAAIKELTRQVAEDKRKEEQREREELQKEEWAKQMEG